MSDVPALWARVLDDDSVHYTTEEQDGGDGEVWFRLTREDGWREGVWCAEVCQWWTPSGRFVLKTTLSAPGMTTDDLIRAAHKAVKHVEEATR